MILIHDVVGFQVVILEVLGIFYKAHIDHFKITSMIEFG